MELTAKRVKDAKIEKQATARRRVKDAKKPKFSTRKHNRCKFCGRPRAFPAQVWHLPLVLPQLALRGEIPGVSKSSW